MAAFTDYKALDFSGIDKVIDGYQQKQRLANLGQGLDGTPEGYAKAGQSLLALGDVQGAQNFFALGEKARERTANETAIKNSPFSATGGVMGAPRAPVAPAVTALGRVAAPRQGVHVAENEDDVQRLERATGMVTTGADKAAIVKTVYGEAANQPAVGQQAVAAVIRNRANQSGLTPADVVMQPNQFEPWNTEAGRARMEGIPQQRFAQIAGTVAPVIDQGLDPTGGATHFYAPKAQAMLGRAPPKWDNGTGQPIADHTFFNLGYGQGGGAPAPSPQSIIASAQGAGGGPQIAQAPQGAPAPAGDALYANTPTPALQAFINNPRVPENLRTIMQQELARREGGGAAPQPVQMAQAPAQPGQPVADMPAQGAAPVQAQFAVPGPNQLPPNDPRPDISTPQLLEVLANPRLASQHGIAKVILDGRQKYSDENAPDKREQTRLATEKAQLDIEKARRDASGLLTPEQEAQKIRMARAGRPVNEPALPPGYRAIRDPEGNIERLEPIPGSKVAVEQEQLAAKKEKADILKAETGNTVANALDDIDRLASSSTLPVAGPLGARVANIPGTAAHDVAKALETVGANISFGQLQQMRESSPTGGALGGITEGELLLLKNSYANLSQSQSAEQFKTNLGRVRATFERIVHGRTLTGQERKTGGPMTMERAKGLREQAQQAIANGAPRDAVLKRLKDDYGISDGGL